MAVASTARRSCLLNDMSTPLGGAAAGAGPADGLPSVLPSSSRSRVNSPIIFTRRSISPSIPPAAAPGRPGRCSSASNGIHEGSYVLRQLQAVQQGYARPRHSMQTGRLPLDGVQELGRYGDHSPIYAIAATCRLWQTGSRTARKG